MNLVFKPILFALLCAGFLAPAFAEEGLPFSPSKDIHELPSHAMIDTNKGSFEIEFFRDEAPITVRNFQYLAEKKFYDMLSFFRYEPGFVIQAGDPKGTGKGGPGYTLPPEFSGLKHTQGTLSMARLPSQVNPERRSNGSQFFITLNKAPHLDGLYSTFAQLVSGYDVLRKLRSGDRILSIRFPKSGGRR